MKNNQFTRLTNDYCYEIQFIDQTTIYLTSSSKIIKIKDIFFYPYSGLQIVEAKFTDSAKDYIILSGIFEDLGINKKQSLLGAKINIFLFNLGNIQPYVSYYITNYTNYDLNFSLKIEPETTKFNQTIVNKYSKTCRANLGDEKCQVNLANFSHIEKVLNIEDKTLTIMNNHYLDGYFDGGSIFTIKKIFVSKIIKQVGNMIEFIDIQLPLVKDSEIILIVGCDKNFISCCNKFNNIVNFRGEPNIPEHKFLNL